MEQYTTEQGVKYWIYATVDEFAAALPKFPITYYSQYKKWLRIPAAFDIETTRIEKRAFMYHWQFALGDKIIMGRTWEQFETLCYYLQNYLQKYDCMLIVWVANLGHEFAFLCKRFTWGKIFARDSHAPLTAETGNLQFREALTLSGIGGLKQLAKNYTTTKKAVNDLDYDTPRNAHTPLTARERGYCIADVAILSEWGEYCFQRWIDCSRKRDRKIPLTATGICRQAVKDAAGEQLDYYKKEARLSYPKTPARYNFIMQYLFRGGYTHANVYWADEVVPDVIGADFTSSYPAVMLHNEYPVGRFFKIILQTDGHEITDPKIDMLCCWFVVKFDHIRSKTNHHIESLHKIIRFENCFRDNGRMIAGDGVIVALTDVDYRIYQMFYEWDNIEIKCAFGCTKARLPEYLLKPLIAAYTTKCDLKRQHMDGTAEYQQAKSLVNSYYGMTVQRLTFSEYTWSPETSWKENSTARPYSDLIRDVFLSPYWGIWVTAHARYQLLKMVHILDPDFAHNNVLYCDTDSIYMIASPDNIAAISAYNQTIEKLNADLPPCCDDLGCFDWIDNRKLYHFKTLGAKRYIKLDSDGHATVTVAGMKGGTYLDSIAYDTPPNEAYFTIERTETDADGNAGKVLKYVPTAAFFGGFENHLLLDMYISGKTTAIYTENPYTDKVCGEEMQEMCGCAIYPIPFEIRMDEAYLYLIQEYHEKERRKPIQF